MLETTTSPAGQADEMERDTDTYGDPAPQIPGGAEDASLADDIGALVDDGKAYVQAELAFQKSRAAFAAHEVKAGAAFAMVMLAFLHLALMGIVVGLIIALAPIVGAFVATAIMGGILLVCTAIFGWLALRRFRKISAAFDNADNPDDGADAGETAA